MTKNTDRILTEIAKKHLDFETLETRMSGDLDFREVAVWSVKSALQEAFAAGKRAACQPKAIAAMQQTRQDVNEELLEALSDLLDFAELYGFKARTTYEDWSGYFEAARSAITKAATLAKSPA
jgi:hypothetical protein